MKYIKTYKLFERHLVSEFEFRCQSQNLTKLPEIPSNTKKLVCYENFINELPLGYPYFSLVSFKNQRNS